MDRDAQPNIVLILTDHLRPDALGPSMPNVMKLADRGAPFANAYCPSPLCQPSRLSIATGLYPSQHGACGNMSEPISAELRDDTFMHHLQKAGYYTALVGKHHFLDRYGIGMDATDDDEEIGRYGYDHVWQVLGEIFAPGDPMHNECRLTHHLREKGIIDEYRETYARNAWGCREFPFEEEDYDDGYIGRMGCGFVRDYAEERPFYLNLSFLGPHPPYWHYGDLSHDPAKVPGPVGAPDSEAVRTRRAHYLDKCSLIDRYVGQLVEVLRERGMLDNTLIVFTSDHGDNLGDYGIWDKRFFYKQSVGVPLVVCGPGVPRGARGLSGKLSKQFASLVDLYPTFLKVAGVDRPSRRRPGKDLLAMLNEEEGASRDEVYAELGTAVMLRTGNWKLVFDPEQGGVQFLFNLAVDPSEEQNLAGVAGYESVTHELLEKLLALRIRLTQFTHDKEEQRVQRVRARN